jgi:hypothetical protein
MKLPIGIQTFKKIIEGNYLYVDKTKYALELIENYEYVFLSRPRRFGKSLFLDTLYEIFNGNKEIFKDLYIYDKYDFEQYPVIKIDWAGDFKTLESTKQTAINILKHNQKNLGIDCELPDDVSTCFDELIKLAYEKYQKRVVILIDEYDKPILDNLDNTTRAIENRDFLRSVYIQLKANDRYIKFAFLTGISKFSKASIFSGLNQIEDISLTPEFGNICGYTQDELEENFSELLKEANKELVKKWYNGYNFLGDRVYNPFDILKFIKNNYVFKNYWWESGNPFSLIELLKKRDYYIPSLENLKTDETLLNTFDIENLQLESLLFQAGYLTIDKTIKLPLGNYKYVLKVPNLEIQISLNQLIIYYLTNRVNEDVSTNIYYTLSEGNLEEFKNTLFSLFASLPYNNYIKNQMAKVEGYWASLVYCYLAGSGVDIIAEDVTNIGRIDLTIKVDKNIYIFEFKTTDEDPLKQIKEKRYYEKYLNEDKNIYLVGITFDEESRNIKEFVWEKLK